MRKILLVIAVILLSHTDVKAYDVFPDSNGNTLSIRINNTSTVFPIQQLKISKQSLPDWVTGLSPNEVNIGTLAVNQSATATFTFNIAAKANIGAAGDMVLQVGAGTGDAWNNRRIPLVIVNPIGSISGKISGSSGAIVQAVGPSGTKTITPNPGGDYIFADLLPGTYTVTASQSGYASTPTSRQVKVIAGVNTAGLDFTLTSIYGSISGKINVPGLLDTSYGTTILAEGHGTKSITIGVGGWYTIPDLIIGTYIVTASKSDYISTPTRRTVLVTRGTTTAGVDFSLIKNPPQSPALNSPGDKTTISTFKPKLDWYKPNGMGTIKYELQVANNASFSSPVVNKSNLSDSAYTLDFDLSNNTTNYWRVRASNEVGTSDWSASWSFTIKVFPGKPVLSSPSNGSTIASLKPAFDWSDVSNATYTIQVDDNNDFSSLVIDALNLSSS